MCSSDLDRRARVALSVFGLALLALGAGLALRQTGRAQPELGSAYAPHIVQTVPVTARPAAPGPSAGSLTGTMATAGEVIPRPVKTVPIIASPSAISSERNAVPMAPPPGSFTSGPSTVPN